MKTKIDFEKLDKGLGRIAFYFFQTYGLPVEMFKEIIEERPFIDRVNLYINFEKKHPELFL